MNKFLPIDIVNKGAWHTEEKGRKEGVVSHTFHFIGKKSHAVSDTAKARGLLAYPRAMRF